jgi:hypothetical protein
MSHYTVSNSKGSFVNEDIDGEKSEKGSTAENTDSVAVTPAVRPVSKRHAATK